MMTVSRALRGVEGVSAARRAEIVELARRLHYVPNSNARSLAAEHVAALGYRRPAFVGAPRGRDMRAEGRLAGLRAVFGDTGRIPVARPASLNEAGFDGAEALLNGTRPDVIFFLNDIGIVGFNGLGLTRVLEQSLTTVITPRRQLGMLGARSLLARINGARGKRAQCLPARLHRGETTMRQA